MVEATRLDIDQMCATVQKRKEGVVREGLGWWWGVGGEGSQ